MPKLQRKFLLVALCMASAFAIPLHAQTPREFTPADAFAQPLLIVQPRFPDNVPAEFARVEVEVAGTIGADGKMRDATVRTPDGYADFGKDVLEVSRMWRFIPAVADVGCEGKDAPGKVIVTFEVKDGKRAIYVTMPAKYKSPRPAEIDNGLVSRTGKGLSMKLARKMQYPQEALRGPRTEGYVLALAAVSPDGTVKNASILASTPNDVFNYTVLNAIRRATFTREKSTAAERDTCVLIPFSFCIPGRADISMESTCLSR